MSKVHFWLLLFGLCSSLTSGADRVRLNDLINRKWSDYKTLPRLEHVTLTTWAGETQAMSAFSGKVVVVAKLDCSEKSTERSVDRLEGWLKKYAAQGLVVQGVDDAQGGSKKAEVEDAVKKWKVTFPICRSMSFARGAIESGWQMSIPGVHIFDQTGKLAYQGPILDSEPNVLLQKLLSKP